MKPAIKTVLLATALLATFSCKKESSNHQLPIQESDASDMTARGYPYIHINGQRWMTRNLDVTRYANGDKIPHVRNRKVWDTLTTGAWCWYNNDSAKALFTAGYLYFDAGKVIKGNTAKLIGFYVRCVKD